MNKIDGNRMRFGMKNPNASAIGLLVGGLLVGWMSNLMTKIIKRAPMLKEPPCQASVTLAKLLPLRWRWYTAWQYLSGQNRCWFMAIWFCGAKMCPAAVGLINTLITFNNHVDVAKKDSMCWSNHNFAWSDLSRWGMILTKSPLFS